MINEIHKKIPWTKKVFRNVECAPIEKYQIQKGPFLSLDSLHKYSQSSYQCEPLFHTNLSNALLSYC